MSQCEFKRVDAVGSQIPTNCTSNDGIIISTPAATTASNLYPTPIMNSAPELTLYHRPLPTEPASRFLKP